MEVRRAERAARARRRSGSASPSRASSANHVVVKGRNRDTAWFAITDARVAGDRARLRGLARARELRRRREAAAAARGPDRGGPGLRAARYAGASVPSRIVRATSSGSSHMGLWPQSGQGHEAGVGRQLVASPGLGGNQPLLIAPSDGHRNAGCRGRPGSIRAGSRPDAPSKPGVRANVSAISIAASGGTWRGLASVCLSSARAAGVAAHQTRRQEARRFARARAGS